MTIEMYIGLPEQDKLMYQTNRKQYGSEVIINAVAKTLDIPIMDIKGITRKREVTEARTIAIGLILQVDKKITLKALGKLFGGRDHTTIIYGRELFNNLYKRDKIFTQKVEKVLQVV